MQNALRPSSLVPAGFAVTSAASVGPVTTLEIRSTGATSRCPACGVASRRVHSRYRRRIVDLPIAGRSVELVATVRRFRCVAVLCRRSIFTERFDDGVLTPWGRRTARLDGLVHHLGLALGGRPGAGFAKRLMLPVSNDTLLRVVRRHGCPKAPRPTAIGIDDWAWRRNHRYGTIICDLERAAPSASFPIASLPRPRHG
jgi:transposase